MSDPRVTSSSAIPRLVRRAFLTAAVLAGSLILMATPGAAAPPSYDYRVTGVVSEVHEVTGTDGEEGLCSTPESAEYNGRFVFELRSTMAGLSDAAVLAVRESEPDGTVISATYEQAGTLVQRSGAHTYSMHYTVRDTARVGGDAIRFGHSFTAIGSSEVGTPYSIRQIGTLVLIEGVPRADPDQLLVRGCLP